MHKAALYKYNLKCKNCVLFEMYKRHVLSAKFRSVPVVVADRIAFFPLLTMSKSLLGFSLYAPGVLWEGEVLSYWPLTW